MLHRKRQRKERFGGSGTAAAPAPSAPVDPVLAQKLADRAKRFATQA